MKIKLLSTSGIESKVFSEERKEGGLPFYTDFELMTQALAYYRYKFGDKYYNFFTGNNISENNVVDISITKVKGLNQIILVCADGVEELAKFKAAFNQMNINKWNPKFLGKKIKDFEDLDATLPDKYKSLRMFTLDSISTFDFGGNFISSTKSTDGDIHITVTEGPRYLVIMQNNIFWLDQDFPTNESNALVKLWEKYKK